jgi:hypothetical protein
VKAGAAERPSGIPSGIPPVRLLDMLQEANTALEERRERGNAEGIRTLEIAIDDPLIGALLMSGGQVCYECAGCGEVVYMNVPPEHPNSVERSLHEDSPCGRCGATGQIPGALLFVMEQSIDAAVSAMLRTLDDEEPSDVDLYFTRQMLVAALEELSILPARGIHRIKAGESVSILSLSSGRGNTLLLADLGYQEQPHGATVPEGLPGYTEDLGIDQEATEPGGEE